MLLPLLNILTYCSQFLQGFAQFHDWSLGMEPRKNKGALVGATHFLPGLWGNNPLSTRSLCLKSS